MAGFFLSLYGMAWNAAMPFLRRNKRLKDAFPERLVPCDWPFAGKKQLEDQPLIWLQAASGGEAMLIRELVPALQKIGAQYLGTDALTLLCTTFTKQGMDVLERIEKEYSHGTTNEGELRLTILPRYFPLDKPALMRKALIQAKPSMICLLETELWPGLMAGAAESSIPLLVLNARMTPKSLSGYKWLSSFWKKHSPAKILAVSGEDEARFAQIFGKTVTGVMENIKFDGVSRQLTHGSAAPAPLNDPNLDLTKAVICLASVREQEEDLLLPEIKKLAASSLNGQRVQIVVAPRHMHRVQAWEKKLSAAGLTYINRSDEGASSKLLGDNQCLVWDVFGRMKELFAVTDAVFIGGSLAPLGGQNFLEPLAQGISPVIGPHWKNFHWVGRSIVESGIVTEICTHQSLAEMLLEKAGERLGCDSTTPQVGLEELAKARHISGEKVTTMFREWLEPRLGGSEQAARAILEHLDCTKPTA